MSLTDEPSPPPNAETTARVPHAPRSARKPPMIPSGVTVMTTPESLESLVVEWEKLGRAALEPNPFLEPWFFLPALRCFATGQEVEVVTVRRDGGELIGLFPLTRSRGYKGIRVATLRSWAHDFSFLGTPLVHAAHGRECLEIFFDWLARDAGATLLELDRVAGDGPFHRLLGAVLEERDLASSIVERSHRGLYALCDDAERYVSQILDGEGRRRLRSKERKLGEQGALTFDALHPAGDAPGWSAEFEALEASGWKGQEGSAMGADPVRRDFFHTVIAAAAQRGQLEMLTLRLDGRPIASKCNFISGDGGFVWKIAYDESHGKFSPGMLLELENIRRMHEKRAPRWMDSCSNPKSRLFADACNDRRAVETVLIAAGPPTSQFIIAALPLAQWATRRARGAVALLRSRIGSVRPAKSTS